MKSFLMDHVLIGTLNDAVTTAMYGTPDALDEDEESFVEKYNEAIAMLKMYTDDKHAKIDEEYITLRKSLDQQFDLGCGFIAALRFPKKSPIFIGAQNAIKYLFENRFSRLNRWPQYPLWILCSNSLGAEQQTETEQSFTEQA